MAGGYELPATLHSSSGGGTQTLLKGPHDAFDFVSPLVRMSGVTGLLPQGHLNLGHGPDGLITISRFDSADEAFASNEKAAT
jgi:hypothetical protein